MRRVASQAEDVLARLELGTHPVILAELEAEVALMRRCMTSDLQRLCPSECSILLDAYDTIKQAFPDRSA